MNRPESALWHPLSALFFVDPPCLASTGLLRMLLRAEGEVRMRCSGDRMWPAIDHGAEILVLPIDPPSVRAGDCVVADLDGLPELARVAEIDPTTRETHLAADADRNALGTVSHGDLLGLVAVPRRRFSRGAAIWRRRWLDLREAWVGHPDSVEDGAVTVHDKYDYQAPFYARSAMATDPALLERAAGGRASGAHILVIGSGSGTEANDLARAGHDVVGIDFSRTMIDLSIEHARGEGLSTRFVCADTRTYDPGTVRFDTILFTYDVYSFIPARVDRIRVMRRMRRWLAPGGRILLSARLVRGPYAAGLLRLGWFSGSRRGPVEPGDSHTRWIAGDGSIHRSYVHLFGRSALERELRQAGLRPSSRGGGHITLAPERLLSSAPVR